MYKSLIAIFAVLAFVAAASAQYYYGSNYGYAGYPSSYGYSSYPSSLGYGYGHGYGYGSRYGSYGYGSPYGYGSYVYAK